MKTMLEARIDAGITQRAAAKKLGISARTLGRYERGEVSPYLDTALAMCDMYGMSFSEITFSELRHEQQELDADYGLRVIDRSMEPTIRKGDIALIKKADKANSGDIAIIEFENVPSVTRKAFYFYHNKGGMILISPDRSIPPIMVTPETSRKIKIKGVIVGYQRAI